MASSLLRVWRAMRPLTVDKDGEPLRIGVLGAAMIAPAAIIDPAKTHPGVEVYAVAARDVAKARAFAHKHGIPHVHENYEALIADERVQAIYNPLPNALHAEWTLRAIEAGKHVLLEKPCASNAAEAERIFTAAREHNVVVLEAFHYRFHPALHEFAFQLYSVMSGTNPLVAVHAELGTPLNIWKEDDIRFNWKLGGGMTMDMGCYTVSAVLYACRAAGGTEKRAEWQRKIEVVDAQAQLFKPRGKAARESKAHCDAQGRSVIDYQMHATIDVPTPRNDPIRCTIQTGLSERTTSFLGLQRPKLLPSLSVRATFKDGSEVELWNFVVPTVLHRLRVTRRGATAQRAGVRDGASETIHAYTPSAEHTRERALDKDEDPNHSGCAEQMRRAAKDGFWSAHGDAPSARGGDTASWTTYRWQLEAFVEAVRKAQAGVPHEQARGTVWMGAEESMAVMRTIDAIYDKAGLPRRGI